MSDIITKAAGLMPHSVVNAVYSVCPWLSHNYRQRKKLAALLCEKYNELESEYPEEIAYLRKNGYCEYPYSYTARYSPESVEVLTDEERKLRYVMRGGKRLYFPRDYKNDFIKKLYAGLCCEQDESSPHRYMDESFRVQPGDIFIDVGCAEAFAALDAAETAERLILFECDKKWHEPLTATFEPFKEKVLLIDKFAGSRTEGNTAAIDDVIGELSGAQGVFIKMDVEGAEAEVLAGAEQTLKRDNVRCACCLYHKQSAEKELTAFFVGRGYSFSVTEGYMLVAYGGIEEPWFRHGVIRAKGRG